MDTKVKISADAADLGRVQNAVQGTNASLGALARLVQGDFVGAMQQGSAGLRQLYRSLAAIPAGGPIVALAASAVVAIKAWEHQTDKLLEKTQQVIRAWKEGQTAFHQVMGWNVTPNQQLKKDAEGLSARDIGTRMASMMSYAAETKEAAAAAQKGATETVFKTVTRAAPGTGQLYKDKVVDEEATQALRQKALAAAQAAQQAAEAVEILRAAYEDAAKREKELADEKRRTTEQAAATELADTKRAVDERRAAWQRLEETGMSPAALSKRRGAAAKAAMEEAATLPQGSAARERKVAEAYNLEAEAISYRDQAAAEEKQKLAEMAADAQMKLREAERLAEAEARAAEPKEIDYISSLEAGVGGRIEAARTAGGARRVMGGSVGGQVAALQAGGGGSSGRRVMGGSVGGLVAALVPELRSPFNGPGGVPARLSGDAMKSPEQKGLEEIKRSIEETNRILVQKLGLPA